MFNPYECMRQFSHDGHFENLLSITEDGSETKWRYGPYLTSSLSPFKKSDYLRLPGKEDVGHLDPRDVPRAYRPHFGPLTDTRSNSIRIRLAGYILQRSTCRHVSQSGPIPRGLGVEVAG